MGRVLPGGVFELELGCACGPFEQSEQGKAAAPASRARRVGLQRVVMIVSSYLVF